MRLLLDAQLSGRWIGEPLRRLGHDVLAATEDPRFTALPDERLLRVAAAEGCIVVTCDMDDFPGLIQEWAHLGIDHAGCIFVPSLRNDEYGAVIAAVQALLGVYPRHEEWVNQGRYAHRSSA